MRILRSIPFVLLLVLLPGFAHHIRANNIIVSNVNITGQNPVDDFSMVTFDVSWENSWRTSTLESNWDAAWIFVKFRLSGNLDWVHASLNNTGHAAPVGSVVTPGLVNTTLPFHISTNPVAGVFCTGPPMASDLSIIPMCSYDGIMVQTDLPTTLLSKFVCSLSRWCLSPREPSG